MIPYRSLLDMVSSKYTVSFILNTLLPQNKQIYKLAFDIIDKHFSSEDCLENDEDNFNFQITGTEQQISPEGGFNFWLNYHNNNKLCDTMLMCQYSIYISICRDMYLSNIKYSSTDTSEDCLFNLKYNIL